MDTKCIYADGTPFPPGWCAMPDHYETTFTVVVRSLRPVSAGGLKAIIERQYEVTSISATAETCVVQNSQHK